MAIRLHAEFTSSIGIDYVINFHDNEFTGTSTKINVSGDGFQLDYSGQTDNIYSPIIGSSLNVNILNRGEPALLQYIELLKQYQQDRFSIVVNRIFTTNNANVFAQYESRIAIDGGEVESTACYKQAVIDLGGSVSTTEELFWSGMIVQDLIEVEDVSFPSIFSIQATDGISKLKDTLCGTSFFRQFTNQFINALDQVGVLDIYDSNDPVLAVVCDWWAQEMTYNANNNPLDEVFADFHAFDTIDEQGFYTNKNWFEILSQMCTIFGLRFYYANGKYRLEQLFIRDNAAFVEHNYKKDKTKIDNVVVSYERSIDQLSGQARLAGNSFNYLPAVNDVSITLNQDPKAMKGVTWKNGVDPDLAIGLVSSALQNQLTFVFNHQIKLFLNVNVNQNNIFAKLKLNVELFDFNNNITYYLDRTYTGTTPSAPVWTTTQSGSGYEILVGTFKEFSGQVTLGNSDVIQIGGPTTIVTPPIPADGDMTINWDFVGFVETNGSVRGLNIGNSSSYKMTLQSVNTSFGSIQNQTTRIRAVSPNADINGLVSYELPETSIFTGQGERGSLVNQYDVGGLLIKIPYSNWREGNSGSYQSIQNLVCQELLKLMNNPVEKYAGSMFSVHDFKERLEFDKKIWIQLGGTFSANMDQWDGEWFAIAKANITPTFDDVIIPTDNVDFGNVNGSTGGVSFDGIDAVNLDTNILDVTTTASVGGNVDVGGDGDFSGRLDVGSDLGVVGNVSATDVQASGNVTAVDVNASGNVSATDLEASGDVLADGAVNADSVNAANDVSGNTLSATTSVSSATLTTTGDATIGGNVSATDVGATNITASNNITASGLLTAGNASLDNFVTKTAIIGSSALVDSFKTRVENDGGTFEAFAAVLDAITPLLIGTAEKSAIVYGETSVETLDASNNITAAGNVSATNVNASNNATVGGALGVTGSTTLSGDTTLESTLNHQGQLIQQITDVTHSSGSRYDVGDTEYMIFNRWSGGNGTATINLPRAGDNEGRLLRFKSDGTISASTSIALRPASPDTIDGDPEFAFNRDYDGVMLLAHNSNWFIIQRKAK